MKRVNVKDQVMLVAKKELDKDRKNIITYYIETPSHEYIYAFKQRYSQATYEMCKTGIRINALVGVRTSNAAVMRLVDKTKRMVPYLADIYELNRAV